MTHLIQQAFGKAGKRRHWGGSIPWWFRGTGGNNWRWRLRVGFFPRTRRGGNRKRSPRLKMIFTRTMGFRRPGDPCQRQNRFQAWCLPPTKWPTCPRWLGNITKQLISFVPAEQLPTWAIFLQPTMWGRSNCLRCPRAHVGNISVHEKESQVIKSPHKSTVEQLLGYKRN